MFGFYTVLFGVMDQSISDSDDDYIVGDNDDVVEKPEGDVDEDDDVHVVDKPDGDPHQRKDVHRCTAAPAAGTLHCSAETRCPDEKLLWTTVKYCNKKNNDNEAFAPPMLMTK